METPEFQIDINILGLRDLQSVGILPVKKAFIVFNLKSLVPPEDGTALDNLKTQPNSPGANPTINTLIQFRIPLPRDPLFCPRLACSVHDYIFKGFSQPMIGAFIIPIGELVFKLQKEREEETAAIDGILQELDKIMLDQGVQSYSIQDSPQIQSFADSLAQDALKKLDQAKKSVKVADEMRQPLLLSSGDQQEEAKDSFVQRSPKSRVTPRSLTMSQTGKNKLPANPLKQQQFDKFNSGMKTALLAQQKEANEKEKRELDDARKRDAEEFKKQMAGAAVKNVVMP